MAPVTRTRCCVSIVPQDNWKKEDLRQGARQRRETGPQTPVVIAPTSCGSPGGPEPRHPSASPSPAVGLRGPARTAGGNFPSETRTREHWGAARASRGSVHSCRHRVPRGNAVPFALRNQRPCLHPWAYALPTKAPRKPTCPGGRLPCGAASAGGAPRWRPACARGRTARTSRPGTGAAEGPASLRPAGLAPSTTCSLHAHPEPQGTRCRPEAEAPQCP